MRNINVRRKGKRLRKANKKFVKLAESIKIKIDAKTIITCRASVLDKWLKLYPNLEIL